MPIDISSKNPEIKEQSLIGACGTKTTEQRSNKSMNREVIKVWTESNSGRARDVIEPRNKNMNDKTAVAISNANVSIDTPAESRRGRLGSVRGATNRPWRRGRRGPRAVGRGWLAEGNRDEEIARPCRWKAGSASLLRTPSTFLPPREKEVRGDPGGSGFRLSDGRGFKLRSRRRDIYIYI